jgi:hypothetical protein
VAAGGDDFGSGTLGPHAAVGMSASDPVSNVLHRMGLPNVPGFSCAGRANARAASAANRSGQPSYALLGTLRSANVSSYSRGPRPSYVNRPQT